MNAKQSVHLMKAVADGSRLRIIRSLLDGPRYVEELSERLDLSPSTVSFHLKKLELVGLVTGRKEQYYTVYRAHEGLLDLRLRDIVSVPDPDRSEEEERLTRYYEKVIATFFEDGRLIRMPAQKKKRRIVLEQFAGDLTPGRTYSEPEMNEVILQRFDDYCLIRRELVEQNMVTRSGQSYRLIQESKRNFVTQQAKTSRKKRASNTMDKRKELVRGYKLRQKTAGIYRVRNKLSGRVLIGSSLNLTGKLNKQEAELRFGSHKNAALQQDWNELGPENFDFEIIDTVPDKEAPEYRVDVELKALEQKWIQKLQPFENNCYNRNEKIRTTPY